MKNELLRDSEELGRGLLGRDERVWTIWKEPKSPGAIMGPLVVGEAVVPLSELERVQALLDEACRHLFKTAIKLQGMPARGDCYLSSRVVAREALEFFAKIKGGE